MISGAEGQLSQISQDAGDAQGTVSANILEPYGYGRRGIDFLLPAILAMTIFQGATMGLGARLRASARTARLPAFS